VIYQPKQLVVCEDHALQPCSHAACNKAACNTMQKWQRKPSDGHASICQGSPYQTVKSYAWQELQVCRTGWRQKKNKREGKRKKI